MRDIAAVRGGIPIPGYVAPISNEYRGIQSTDTAPPVRPTYDDFHYHAPVVPLVGKVTVLPPAQRPWWAKHGVSNPLTRQYVDGVAMDIEVPVESLDSVQEWEDIG